MAEVHDGASSSIFKRRIQEFNLLWFTMYRFGHFFEKQFDAHVSPMYFTMVVTMGWAFQFWYAGVGVIMLSDYLSKYMFGRYFDESQWGLICPVVSTAVLGSFVYKEFLSHPVVLVIIGMLIVLDVILIMFFMNKQIHKMFDPTISDPELAHAA